MALAFDDNHWFRSGDIGYFDEHNELFLIDRQKDIIKHCGFHISPSELEEFIVDAFDVIAVIVVGIPDDDTLLLPAAVIVRSPTNPLITEADVLQSVAGEIGEMYKSK